MSASHFHPLRAFGFLCAAQIQFALLDAAAKSLSADMGIPLIAAVRHGGQVLLMALVLGPRLGLRLVATQRASLQLYRGLVLGGFTLFFFSALHRLPQAEATAINFIAPFLVMLLAGRWLGERVFRAQWLGALAGFAGVLVLVRPGTALDPLGVAFVLATVACNVVFQILTRKLALTDGVFATMFISALLGMLSAMALLPFQDVLGGWPQHVTGQQLGLFTALAVFGALSQWCLLRAYVESDASFIAPLLFVQLVWSTAAGWAFFDQLPDAVSFAGIVLILVSGVATMLWMRAQRKERA